MIRSGAERCRWRDTRVTLGYSRRRDGSRGGDSRGQKAQAKFLKTGFGAKAL